MIFMLILEGELRMILNLTSLSPVCSSCMKIWQTIMTMRDESKQVQEAVYEAITKGWVPIAVNPLLDVAYLVYF